MHFRCLGVGRGAQGRAVSGAILSGRQAGWGGNGQWASAEQDDGVRCRNRRQRQGLTFRGRVCEGLIEPLRLRSEEGFGAARQMIDRMVGEGRLHRSVGGLRPGMKMHANGLREDRAEARKQSEMARPEFHKQSLAETYRKKIDPRRKICELSPRQHPSHPGGERVLRAWER